MSERSKLSLSIINLHHGIVQRISSPDLQKRHRCHNLVSTHAPILGTLHRQSLRNQPVQAFVDFVQVVEGSALVALEIRPWEILGPGDGEPEGQEE